VNPENIPANTTTGSMNILNPLSGNNKTLYPPSALQILKSLTPPSLKDFRFLL